MTRYISTTAQDRRKAFVDGKKVAKISTDVARCTVPVQTAELAF